MARIAYAELPDDLPVRNNIVGMTYNNPDMHRGFASFSGRVQSASHLPGRLRELVVLTIVGRVRAQYEWRVHRQVALGSGVTEAEADAIQRGDYSSFSGAEAAALALASSVDGVTVSNPLWEEAGRHFSEVELLDLVMLAAFYGCAARICHALDIDVAEHLG